MTQDGRDSPPHRDAGLFESMAPADSASLVVVGVPWEPTASYGRGAANTPKAIVRASHQLDCFDPFLGASLEDEVAMSPVRDEWIERNEWAARSARPIIEATGVLTPELRKKLDDVNRASAELNRELREEVARLLAEGKSVGVLGGDHSSPLGAMLAQADHHGPLGVLHVDAHHDLREAYGGFTYSHASIIYNLLRSTNRIEALVSVGVRDYSEDEARFAEQHPAITVFYDRDLKSDSFGGASWNDSCSKIVQALPEKVYVSFDIDGLDPKLCPHTGTPVAGGLDFAEACHLLERMVASGRRIIGFDLCEVAPNAARPDDEWDLNVGARILHKLCVLTWMGRSGRTPDRR